MTNMQPRVLDEQYACKGIKIPMETLYGHLPEVDFHTPIQKVRGYVDGFTSYAGITINQKILFCSQAVKGEISCGPLATRGDVEKEKAMIKEGYRFWVIG